MVKPTFQTGGTHEDETHLGRGGARRAARVGGTAQRAVSDGVVKIGVLNDMSGLYADLAGPGSVVAARMAVEDFWRHRRA